MDVTLVRWPSEGTRRGQLVAAGQARLLLLEAGAEPPPTVDCLEDWIRLPAADPEVRWRLAALAARAEAHRPPLPVLDDDGVLRFAEEWVSLPPVETRLVSAMLSRLGAVVSREALSRAGWPHGAPGRNALDVHVLRLRRRLRPLGLVIRTVRSRGYLLEVAGSSEGLAASG